MERQKNRVKMKARDQRPTRESKNKTKKNSRSIRIGRLNGISQTDIGLLQTKKREEKLENTRIMKENIPA